ncbi:MAG: hypothetical protein HY519_04540 [Candidatus Aenigmarchaeota archaeon]|nr:hypothetical protein [Candidatus Aenigmarchaeota archaeon]
MVKIPFFGGKKEKQGFRLPAPERVSSLSSQGMSEIEIIKSMREEGYSPLEVDMAIKQAVKTAAAPTRPLPQQQPTRQDPFERPLPGQPFRPMEYRRQMLEEEDEFSFGDERKRGPDLPELPSINFKPPPPFGQHEREDISLRHEPKGSLNRRELEEVTEAIVQDKWRAFEKTIADLNARLSQMATRMDSMDGAISQLKGVEKNEIEEIKNSIGTYRESINEMSGKMESIEKAMKDSLTPMLQTLRSLSDTIKMLKKKEGEQ